MKKSILFTSLLATMALASGCTKSQTPDIKKNLDNKIAEINRQNEERLAEVDRILDAANKFSTEGGQPGKIELTGALVLDTDKLDSRISFTQTEGLNRTGSATAIAASQTAVLKTLDSEKAEELKASALKLEDERTYINLGCELAESEIAGLNEIKAKISTEVIESLSASRIFICGEQQINKLTISLTASEIMLKDANISVQKNLSTVSLNAATLVLIGKNKIISLGEDGSSYLLRGADLSLTIAKEIYGDGELSITSKGANNIAPAAKVAE